MPFGEAEAEETNCGARGFNAMTKNQKCDVTEAANRMPRMGCRESEGERMRAFGQKSNGSSAAEPPKEKSCALGLECKSEGSRSSQTQAVLGEFGCIGFGATESRGLLFGMFLS